MTTGEHTIVDVSASTDVGLRRQHNEDSHGIWQPSDPGTLESRGVLMVVADGMGGSQAGEVASRIAFQTVIRVYQEGSGDPLEDLANAVAAANAAVHGESTSRPDLAGMGTTCTAVVVQGNDLLYAHVGDSRAYVSRHGRIRQVTHDHSLVAQMVREGQLTPEQAKSDPRRNVVTRSVGVGPDVEIDADRMEAALEPGDTLLVCSDGLHGLVNDEELADIASGDDLEAACHEAIDRANQRGGPDNITVVLARIEEPGAGGVQDEHQEHESPALRTAEYPPERGGARLATAGGGTAAQARPSSGALMLWLIVAFAILLLAVVAITIIWQRIDRERRALDASAVSVMEETSAWRL
jgi:protein phosphatase